MDEECIDRTKSAVERVAIAGAKVILTGSLMISLLLPEYEGFLHPSYAASVAPPGAVTAVPHQEHDGLHDHREDRSIIVRLTSPIIVTGAGLSDQPDLWLNRA